ncbi:unnamed protein product [Ectocarpus sp. 12 AP-2014]
MSSRARRWVLRSPRREGEAQEALVGNEVLDKGAAPRDKPPLVATSDTAAPGSRSSSLLSRLRSKLPASTGILHVKRSTKGRRRSPREGAGSTSATSTPHLSPGFRSENGTTAAEAAAEKAIVTEREKVGEEATSCLSVLPRGPLTAGDTRESLGRSSTRSHKDRAGHHFGDKTQGGAHSASGAQHEEYRGHSKLDVGEHALSAVKAGRQAPRIAFIGVFLNGVAVGLATFVPFGGDTERIALVKEVLLQPSSSVSPGGCYTARGSALAVHFIVDHKHRVYACITAEEVPLSVGLSLLEEVQIEYISTVSTLAFSTKENSQSARCHAQLSRTWAKYEGIERTLARERETRRLLGEDPPDIESPLSGDNKTYGGAEVTHLNFTAEHQATLKAATQEVFSLKEGNEKREVGADVARPDDSFAATRVRSGRKRIKSAILLLASGVAVACTVLYAARRANFVI